MNSKLLVGLGIVALLGVLFWPSGSSQKVKTLFEEGEQFLAAKKYADAIGKYEESLAESQKPFVKTEVIDPDFPTLANYKIAFCYTQLAEQTGDLSKYDDALRIVEPLYAKATVPKHRELITFLWGYVLFKQQKFAEAEPKFREVIENFPNSIYLENAWYSIAQLNYQLKEYDKARSAYKALLDNFPNSEFRDDSQHLIGQSFLIEKNYEQAFRAFDVLTYENFPESKLVPEAQYKAAYCLLQLDRLEEAIDRYNRFLANFPNSGYVTAAYFDLGTIYTRQKDYDNAIQNYQLAIQNTDNVDLKAEIQYEIGDNYMEAEDYPNAVIAYRAVIEQYPQSPYVPAARFNIGEAYMKFASANSKANKTIDTENYRNAIAAYQESINENPGSAYEPHATFQIAEAYYQLKDYESSLRWYDTVMERFPADELAAYALYGALWSLSELGRNDEVLARGRAFIEEHSKDPNFDLQSAEIQMKLGDIMYEQKKYDVAAEEYAKVLLYPQLPKFYAVKLRSLFQQAVAYIKLAETTNDNSFYPKAIAALNAAIERYSDDKFDMNYEFPERGALLENAILNKCLAHERLSQWAEARATYRLIPPQSENYGRALVLTAETYEKEGNINEAINQYKAIASNKALGETWQSLGAIRQADLLRGASRFAEAAEAYRLVAEQYPNSSYVDAARYLVGLSYYSIEPRTEQTLRDSISAFRTLVDNYPNSPNAPDAMYGIVLSTKALAEMGKASWEEVVTYADELLTKYGDRQEERAQKAINSGNLLKVMALEKLGSGDVDEIVARLRAVVENKNADEVARTTAQLKIGNVYFERERYAEAMPEYQALAEMYPQGEYVALAYYQAGVCAFKIGEASENTNEAASQRAFAQSAEYMAKAMESNPSNTLTVSILYTMGLAQSKTGRLADAIATLSKLTAMEANVEPEKQSLVFASHVELARLYQQTEQFAEAAREYDYVAQRAPDRTNQGRALMALADIYENQLKDKTQAAATYLRAADTTDDGRVRAQALYRAGLLLSDLQKRNEAIDVFQKLQTEFVSHSDSNVQLMVADAGIRVSDLYLATNRLNEAIAQAEAALNRAMQTTDVVQKVQAQYQVANLRANAAQRVFDRTPNAANTEYKRISRQAIQEYLKVVELAQPLDRAPENARVYVGPALYQAGQIAYAIHGPQDLPIAVDALTRFVDYVERGIAKAGSNEEIKTALYYAGVSLYDLARGNNNDRALFARSGATLTRLVQKFPRDPEAGLWQYQVGEAYFAAQDFQKALDAYLAVVNNYPRHESAAEALYSAAACYYNLKNEAQVYATYERLARDYPSSKFAGEALLNVANARYNEAASITNESQRVIKLKQALDLYRRVQALAGAAPELKLAAKGYAEETEEILAAIEYGPIEQAQNVALSAANKEQALMRVIERYQNLMREYPNSSSALIAMTKIGDCYVALERWQEGLDWYNRLMTRFVDAQGRPMTPGNEYVSRALNYARTQYVAIRAYLQQSQGTTGKK